MDLEGKHISDDLGSKYLEGKSIIRNNNYNSLLVTIIIIT